MKSAEAGSLEPWQPLTPRGVARFADASWKRVATVLLIFAAVAGVSTATFFASAWFPTIREAMRALPESGHIRGGRLTWSGEPSFMLAKSSWLAVTVDLHHQQTQRFPCDLQVEFSADSVRFLSLAGYVDVRYPTRWIIAFNQPELLAWWAAWEPFLVAGIGLATFLGLLPIWTVLAALYAIPAAAVCRFVHHRLPWTRVFRMCLAAQMPGCLLLSFTILLYSVRAVDLVQWLFVAGSHFVASWLYIGLAVFLLPEHRPQQRRSSNPFRGWADS